MINYWLLTRQTRPTAPLTLLVINKDPTNTLTRQITLNGFCAQSDCHGPFLWHAPG
jgi:hypothetical protein